MKDLPEDQKTMIANSNKHYIPWRFVQNQNSLSTPTRIVFDGSAVVTKTGISLNECVAKGIKSLNPLNEIFIRFRVWDVAMHSDVKKMYNQIKLKVAHWRFQLYLWHHGLDVNKDPEEKIIKLN